MKLSERIDEMRHTGMHGAKMFNLLDECAALARRVEGAAVRNVVGQQWDDVFAREGNVVWCSDLNPGQRVALVTVEVGA